MASHDKREDVNVEKNPVQKQRVTALACFLGGVASIGGFIFGYVSGQISGFFLMNDYARRFGTFDNGSYNFSAARQGTIVGLVCVGALIGALIAGRLADMIGRRLCISAAALFTCVGTVIEISSSTHWAQFAVGRLVTGLSIGALSVVVPMYQSESVPAVIRGVVVSSYQLLITLGIWTAEMVNWGTESMDTSAAWRIPNGLSFAWALILGVGILFLPESPRFAYSRGKTEKARNDIARLCGLPTDAHEVQKQIDDLQAKIDEEQSQTADLKWTEIFTGPRMMYRIILGIVLQAGQQLTGANFFFYFGTTVFAATGIDNSYTTQLILGSVNVLCTVAGLWIIKRFGRRPILMTGAAWMMMCFLVYAFVGHFALDRDDPTNTPKAGSALVTFSCLAIAAFAVSWGPLVWAVNAELYPLRYRSSCMAMATASNWLWNFLISFFTRFITDAIDYLYGLVFAGCCAALFFIVFFFVIESKDRTLEEIDRMYVERVNPITERKPEAEESNATEDSPEFSQLKWSSLQPNGFFSAALAGAVDLVRKVRAGGEQETLRTILSEDTPTGIISPDDVGAFAAHLLLESDVSRHNRAKYVLNGPEDITGADVVKLTEEYLGESVKDVSFKDVSFTDYMVASNPAESKNVMSSVRWAAIHTWEGKASASTTSKMVYDMCPPKTTAAQAFEALLQDA